MHACAKERMMKWNTNRMHQQANAGRNTQGIEQTTDERMRERPARTNKQTTERSYKKMRARTIKRHENLAKIAPGTLPERSGRGQNRPKFDCEAFLARSWAIRSSARRSGSAPSSAGEGPRTLPGRSRDASGRSWDAWGRCRDASKSVRDEFFA